jgi:hypothetical protein
VTVTATVAVLFTSSVRMRQLLHIANFTQTQHPQAIDKEVRHLLHEFLSKDCRSIPNPATVFTNELMSKEQWGFVLGVSRKTLQRWELQIIRVCNNYQSRYYGGILPGSANFKGCMLDGYRKFLLFLIAQLKKNRKTNKQVIDYLNDNEDTLTRRNFTNWRKHYEAQRFV